MYKIKWWHLPKGYKKNKWFKLRKMDKFSKMLIRLRLSIIWIGLGLRKVEVLRWWKNCKKITVIKYQRTMVMGWVLGNFRKMWRKLRNCISVKYAAENSIQNLMRNTSKFAKRCFSRRESHLILERRVNREKLSRNDIIKVYYI